MSEADWQQALGLPVFAGLSAEERDRLVALAQRLVADKTFSGAAGMPVDGVMAATIAAQAVLPILHLGYDWYAGWQEVIVYPGEFVPEREEVDEAGVVHHVRRPLSGEAWAGGPLVLSWGDVEQSGHCEGYNVVIHEFAHKLDMSNGAVDGLPRLASTAAIEAWAAAFSPAYEDFCRRVDAGEATELDPYASESPAEFFAVLSEYFFEWPEPLFTAYPAVYQQMQRFYRQDTLARLKGQAHDLAAPR
ncbi:MAG: zinc-dependent peptidase [Hydrogenophilaceae bacterium]|nr:zinc-dependent peptidase [Hydrogenophilaceae bacterium]